MSYKGIFKPKNPAKYKGNFSNIIYRSSYELRLMSYLDAHPNIIEWSSEEIIIPYRSPIDNKMHRYYPDFYVKKINDKGLIETLLIEVKPKTQTQQPLPLKVSAKPTKKYLREVMNWGINTAKWKAAENFCIKKDWKFIIMTEKDLGVK